MKLIDARRLAGPRPALPAPLHEFQWEGVSFLLQSGGALLADEMGLGKTVQASVALDLLLAKERTIERALIVAPASLVPNWMEELARWAPSLTVRRADGGATNRQALYMLPVPVLVCSYEQLRADALERIPAGTFDIVVLDEAQRIKNPDSTTALACRILSRKRSWALSATPFENSDRDVTSILGFVAPGVDVESSRRRLAAALKEVMLRRRKAEVKSELPPVITQDLKLELSAPQRHAYIALWAEQEEAARSAAATGEAAVLLGLITRLKLVCNFDPDSGRSSKLEALRDVIDSAGPDARVLVFSQFVRTLRRIAGGVGVDHDFLVGSMRSAARREAIMRFQTGRTPRILLASLRAAGVGLNLGAASHVVLFDRWWNPAVESQAVYRAHRFDREAPLHVVRFLVVDSVEERIAAILDEKEVLRDRLLESADGARQRPTARELARILGLPVTEPGLDS